MAGEVIKLSGLDGAYDMLRKLPAETVSKRGGVVKAALRKGARVILLEEALNLARSLGSLDADEQTTTGLLQKNLVISRGKPPTSGKGERAVIRVRRKSYQRRGETVTTLKSAQIKEYGSEKQKAEPWIRPAFNAKAREAISTVEAETVAGIERAAKKLLRGGR
jgi:HK97 gp10 family phage protein